ncbi:BMFP domain-containing protein YqiC [Ammoniphilus resinae]|uniref:BMFP domain-containing protein YqiC n=2 Tax=Ammoniphilus resinae TaxID=861532 RepID=A0ABS4GJZ1_9BACL|nr:BMFP domain-containing protein YqiC [Ammoniphilus resinae]
MMDMNMIQQLLSTVSEALPTYLKSLEQEFENEHGKISEEQREVFDFVQKKAKDFLAQMNPLG